MSPTFDKAMSGRSERYLVTGGQGFIGSNLLTNWAAEHAEVAVLCSLDRRKLDEVAESNWLSTMPGSGDVSGRQFVADLNDLDRVTEILERSQPTHVIHLAAETSVDSAITDPQRCIRDNSMATFNLLEAIRSYLGERSTHGKTGFRFVYVSTDEVYGAWPRVDVGGEEADEWAPLNPGNPYSASKASGEAFTRAWGKTYGVPYVIVRPCNNFGQRQDFRKLIPNTVRSAVLGEAIPVYGDGEQVREWLHVNDTCRALWEIGRKANPGSVYNVGSGIRGSVNDIVRLVCWALDDVYPRQTGGSYLEQIKYVRDRPGHDVEYRIDSRRLRRELGWMPKEDFETALTDTVRWYIDQSLSASKPVGYKEGG